MEKRFLIFIFLSLVILTVYQSLVVKPIPQPGQTGPGAAQTSGPAARPAAAAPAPTPTPNAAPTAQAPTVQTPPAPAAEIPALVGETSERDITIETRDVSAVFTNRGARLKSWRLKHYFDQDRHPQELVEKALPNEPLPFTLQTEDNAA